MTRPDETPAAGAPTTPSPAGGADVPAISDAERRRRWRLLLGAEAQDGLACTLAGADLGMDQALGPLYDNAEGSKKRTAGLGSSAPVVMRWLGDIRTYFPQSVVQIMQKDALERLNLTAMLTEPELLATMEADVHLVTQLISLNRVIPEQTKATARMVVAKVVADIERRITTSTTTAVTGALDRAARTARPRPRDIDWNRTIRANLGNYLPEHRTLVPERLIGYGRTQRSVQRDIVLAIDQSGSMASSVVYSSIFGAVLASMRSLKTSLVVFDTAVVDLTEKLSDPVDLLFGTQLGGGTDINRAIAYSQTLITAPTTSIFVLISDLYEGGIQEEMIARVAAMKAAGVTVIVLLALSDDGAPEFDRENAAALAALGAPAFACTPDQFPELLALALTRGDITGWANKLPAATPHPRSDRRGR